MTFASLPVRRLIRRPIRRQWVKLAATALAGLTGLCLIHEAAFARDGRSAKREEVVQSRPAGVPVMAVVSLRHQRVTIYDADGWIMRAPVSTGQTGYETPAGIFSVLQRKAEHFSNLYDDAAMPFMQRLTWSGIALHGGALPGYPASHGCVRMPHGFAERLFEVTRLGMRVIVMPDDNGPADFAHPFLFKPALGGTASASVVALDADPRPVTTFRSLRKRATAKAAEAEAASKRVEEARVAAAAKYREAARANKALRVAQAPKFRAEFQLREAERRLEVATEPAAIEAAQEAKTNALTKIAETQSQLEAVQAEVQPALDAAAQLREEVVAAERARLVAEEEAKAATRQMAPISVFISRQTQRLYVRQAREPLFESPVTIADPDRPLGTYIFTALAYTKNESDLRWSAVSMYGGSQPRSKGQQHRGAAHGPEASNSDTASARSALDRISIPEDALERISDVVSPGSALIVSDEALSKETGQATEFVVIMSGEPQGGLKIRRREPEARNRYERYLRRGPYGFGPSFW